MQSNAAQIRSTIIRHFCNAPLGIRITWRASVTLRATLIRSKCQFRLTVNITILRAMLLFSFFLRHCTQPNWQLARKERPTCEAICSCNVTRNTRSTSSVHDSKHMRLVRSQFWCISLYDRLVTSGENKLSVNWTRSAKLGETVAVYCMQHLYQGGHGFDCMKMEFCLCIFHICVGNKQTEDEERLLKVATS
jgi:hypothetical protein